MKKIILVYVVISFSFFRCFGQDFHLSHFDANPLYLNPALTGLKLDENWDYRLFVNYREQGGKYLGGSNLSFAAGIDKPLNNKFSIGQFVIDNRTVNRTFNTFNFMLSSAYRIIHENSNGLDKHNLSVGLQMGLLQKGVYPSDFVYGLQYSPSEADGFDESLPSFENFTKQSFFSFDANIGVFYSLKDPNKKYAPFGGLSIYHLTQPNGSFTSVRYKTPMRFNLHGGCDNVWNERFKTKTQLLYMNQAKAAEVLIKLLGFYQLPESKNDAILGVAWRNKDAVILHIGLKQKNNIYRISYDINTSYLKNYSNGRGGLEMSVIFAPQKKKPEEPISESLQQN